MRWLIFLIFPVALHAQDTLQHSFIGILPSLLDETSGLEMIEGSLWSFSDGGGAATLYQVDTINASIIRSVSVNGSSNVDWEDIAADEDYVYIGDFGNNNGDRTDLAIYRIDKDSLLNTSVNSVMADTIRFSYGDQVSFNPSPNATDHDCEAMIAQGDSIYLFTKRWLDGRSFVYAMSRNPGQHIAMPVDSIGTNGLVTGADLSDGNMLSLCGYSTSGSAFLRTIEGFSFPTFSNGVHTPWFIDEPLMQVEGICFTAGRKCFLSSESIFGFIDPRLWELEVPLPSGIDGVHVDAHAVLLMDNGFVWHDPPRADFRFAVYGADGSLLQKGKAVAGQFVKFSDSSQGVHFLQLTSGELRLTTKFFQ